MSIRFVESPLSDDLIQGVLSLSDKHKRFLGFLPKAALTQFARTPDAVLVALSKDALVGFVLYRLRRRDQAVAITQLCVDEAARRTGVAQSLVRRLSSRFEHRSGLAVVCRKDYPADKVWPSLGFQFDRESAGRAKSGSVLRHWRRDHGHPTLFNCSASPGSDRMAVAIDVNVLVDLVDPAGLDAPESTGLTADWLADEIELCFTPELRNELREISDEARRSSRLAALRRFKELSGSAGDFDQKHDALLRALPEPRGKQGHADYRQVAWAAACDADVFCTRDDPLLGHGPTIERVLGLPVVRPAELVVELDRVRRAAAYSPSRFSGSASLVVRPATDLGPARLAPVTDSAGGERGSALAAQVRQLIADPESSVCRAFLRDDSVIGLLGYVDDGTTRVVRLLRVLRGSDGRTLADEIVDRLCEGAIGRPGLPLEIADEHVSPECQEALQVAGFDGQSGRSFRVSLSGVVELGDLSRLLSPYASWRDVSERSNQLITAAANGSREALLQLQRRHWPARVLGADVDTFVVPIRPEWAQELFDTRLADESLFGCEERLLFRRENVYYRSAAGPLPAPGDQVLWYVSRDPRHRGIRAVATVAEASVMTAKAAFKFGSRFGVYRWEDVLRTAKLDADGPVMVISFEGVREFQTPLGFQEMQELLEHHGQPRNQFQGPVSIARPAFVEACTRGLSVR